MLGHERTTEQFFVAILDLHSSHGLDWIAKDTPEGAVENVGSDDWP